MSQFLWVFLLIGLLLVFLSGFYSKWRKELHPFGIRMGFLIKVSAGFFLIYTYTSLYPKREEADVFKYFDDGVVLNKIRQENPMIFTRIFFGSWSNEDLKEINRMNYWFRAYDHGLSNDNRVVIRLNAFLNIFTQGNYALNALFFILLSFIGSMNLYRFFLLLSKEKIISYISAFCIPSCVFWSSGILKEAIVLFALGTLLLSLYRFLKEKSWAQFVWFLGAFLLLTHIKVYIILSLLPFLIIGIVAFHFNSKMKIFTFSLIILSVMALGFKLLFPNWDILSTIQGKQFDFIQMARAVNAGSQVFMQPLEHSFFSLIKLFPRGIWNVFYYPNLSMVKNSMSLASFLENLLISILFLGTVFKIIQDRSLKFSSLLLLGFVFVALGIIGITSPVVGAMVRYKSPILPFLFFVLLQNQVAFISRIPFNSKIYKWLDMRL